MEYGKWFLTGDSIFHLSLIICHYLPFIIRIDGPYFILPGLTVLTFISYLDHYLIIITAYLRDVHRLTQHRQGMESTWRFGTQSVANLPHALRQLANE